PPWDDRRMEHTATPQPSPASPAAPEPGPDVVHVERTGTRRYVGTNSRGAQLQIGGEDTEGVFTPGELLAIALGACNVMTADFPLSRRLGEEFSASASVGRTKLTAENRYTAADVDLLLGPEAAERLADLEPVVRGRKSVGEGV